MIGKTVSHYKILEQIGAGGMGVVFKAEDTRLSRIVALKFLPLELTSSDRLKRRFIREAQAAASLDQHPSICHIHEVDETEDGQLFIAMAYYDGMSMHDRLEAGPLSIQDAFGVAMDVADGLSLAHSKGIVHRDLKPGNIMLTGDGHVKIVDFGLAKVAGASKLTRSGAIPGTIAYMAPEQAKSGVVDGRTDIWALGVLLYEALTGKLPFRGDIDEAMIYSILSEDHKPIREHRSEVPEGFAAVIDKCLAKDAADRYQNADEMITDLTVVAGELGWASGSGFKHSSRLDLTIRRHRLRMGAIIGVAVVAAVFAVWWFGIRDPLYTTELRVGAFPFRNLAKVEFEDELVAGLFEQSVGVLEQLSNDHPSMWVVPYDRIFDANVATVTDMQDVFGVNRVLAGSIQRFEDGYRLSLELLDAKSGHRLQAAAVGFHIEDMKNLPERVLDALAEILAVDVSQASRTVVLREMSADDDSYRSYLTGLGHLQSRSSPDEFRRAVALFERSPSFAPAQAGAALAHRFLYKPDEEHEYEAAIAACSTAIALDSLSTSVNLATGWVYEWASMSIAARRAYHRVLEANPTNTNARARIAAVLSRIDGRLDEAEAEYSEMIARKPDYYRGYALLGASFHSRDRRDDGIRLLQQALTLAPNQGWVLYQLSAIYLLTGEWAEGRNYAQRAFAANPNCGSCQNVGTAFYFEGRFDDAADYFEFALQYCDSTLSNHYLRWQDLGTALWLDGRTDEATEKLLRAIRLAEQQRLVRPTDAQLLAYIGGCYALIGNRDAALEALEASEQHVVDKEFTMFLISYGYEQLGERERALFHIGEAIRHHQPVRDIRAEPLMSELVSDTRFDALVDAILGDGDQRSESN